MISRLDRNSYTNNGKSNRIMDVRYYDQIKSM
jgi:hypothetical protein